MFKYNFEWGGRLWFYSFMVSIEKKTFDRIGVNKALDISSKKKSALDYILLGLTLYCYVHNWSSSINSSVKEEIKYILFAFIDLLIHSILQIHNFWSRDYPAADYPTRD